MTNNKQLPSPNESIIEVYKDGQWIQAATLSILGTNQCRLDYFISYLFSDNPQPISCGIPLDWEPDQLINGIEIDDYLDRRPPSIIYDLVPQGQGRKFLLKNIRYSDDDNLIMPLVAIGAFNPIGNLRLTTAVDFYKKQIKLNQTDNLFNGVELKEIIEKSDNFLDHVSIHAMLASGTTGVQGVAPKYLLTQDVEGKWHADMSLDDKKARKHWLVKLPRGQNKADLEILQNEAAYLKVAQACSLRSANATMMATNMLFVERFDRSVIVNSDGTTTLHRLHQESLASLAGLRGFAPSTSQNELLNAIRRHCTDPLSQTIEFMKRDVLNLALRNTDNHARNNAIQTTINGETQLTPWFDFAPMFMDPEIIPRSIHWKDGNGKRFNNWKEIINNLNVQDWEKFQIEKELADFSVIIGNLPEIARECGVTDYVLEQCKKSIEVQFEQLSELENIPNTPGVPRG